MDLLGNPIEIGSRVAFATRCSDIAAIHVGTVVDIVEVASEWSDKVYVKLKIKREASSYYNKEEGGKIVTLEHFNRVVVLK